LEMKGRVKCRINREMVRFSNSVLVSTLGGGKRVKKRLGEWGKKNYRFAGEQAFPNTFGDVCTPTHIPYCYLIIMLKRKYVWLQAI